MKRKIISALIILTALFGAVESSAQFRYGAMIGGNMTNLNFKQDIASVDNSFGYSAGVVTEMMFPGIGFGIDFGLYYEQRGATLGLNDWPLWQHQGITDPQRVYLHYAVIPIHVRFKYTNLNGFEDTLAPFVFAGPSIGLLLGHSKLESFQFPFGEFGIDFGIGAEILRKWQFSLSYNIGFTYALKDRTLTNYSARNNTLSLRAAYFF